MITRRQPVVFLGQAGGAQLLDDGREETAATSPGSRSNCRACRVRCRLGQHVLQLLVSRRIVEIAADVVNALGEPVPQVGIDLGGGELADLLADLVAELLGGQLVCGRTPTRANSCESRLSFARL